MGCVDESGGDEDSGEKEESPCYKAFQDCSGSVILVPDLYQSTPSISAVDDGLVVAEEEEELTTKLPNVGDNSSTKNLTKLDP